MTAQALPVIVGGVFVLALGILIKYARMMHLIAGYDPDEVVDEEGLANFVGAHTILVGGLALCIGLAERRGLTASSEWYWIAFVIAVFAIAARMILGARRYTSSSDPDRTK
jgi:hypothetical protein